MGEYTMYICPKCGENDAYFVIKNNMHCTRCGTKLVKTKYSTANCREDKLYKDYVFNSKEFDENLFNQRIQAENSAYETMVNNLNKKKNTNSQNAPKCPTCGSTNIARIGTAERGVSVGLFGLFSSKIGKTMKCKNCGYKW